MVYLPTMVGVVPIRNVLLIPGHCRDLLSIRCLAKDLNLILSFDDDGFNVKVKGGATILSGTNCTRLY